MIGRKDILTKNIKRYRPRRGRPATSTTIRDSAARRLNFSTISLLTQIAECADDIAIDFRGGGPAQVVAGPRQAQGLSVCGAPATFQRFGAGQGELGEGARPPFRSGIIFFRPWAKSAILYIPAGAASSATREAESRCAVHGRRDSARPRALGRCGPFMFGGFSRVTCPEAAVSLPISQARLFFSSRLGLGTGDASRKLLVGKNKSEK